MTKVSQQRTFSPSDWSEFHVWSPTVSSCASLPVTMTKEAPRPDGASPHVEVVKSLTAPLVACSACVQMQAQGFTRQLRGTVKNIRDRHQRSKTDGHEKHRPGVVYEIYAQFAAGAIGGAVATYSTHWLDTVKVKMQTLPGVYPGAVSCLRDTFRQEGLRGLYQGAAPALAGQTCKTAVVFMSYGMCEQLVQQLYDCAKHEDLSICHHASAGAMTGVVASFILCPMELLKCRLQALQTVSIHVQPTGSAQVAIQGRSSLSMARQILTSEGIRGLYRGLPGIWVKEVPGSFIYFGSYELAKSCLRRFNEKHHLNRRAVFLSGVFAGLCFCVTHPIESVKTRVQVVSAVSKTGGFARAFVNIIRTEGVIPLFSGMAPSMMRACLYSGIQFLIYETVKDLVMDHRR